jgi:hypothetical protein
MAAYKTNLYFNREDLSMSVIQDVIAKVKQTDPHHQSSQCYAGLRRRVISLKTPVRFQNRGLQPLVLF